MNDPTQRLLRAVVDGYPHNPGDSDLDDEQPIHVKMTLGDYRLARALRTPDATDPVTLTTQQLCDISNALRTEAAGFRKTALNLSSLEISPKVDAPFIAKAKELESLAMGIEEALSVKIERKPDTCDRCGGVLESHICVGHSVYCSQRCADGPTSIIAKAEGRS